jgi:adenylate kinase
LCDLDGSKLVIRNDDRQEVISERLSAYEQMTKPVVEYYRAKGCLVPVNADRTPEEITAELFGVIDGHAAVQTASEMAKPE